MAGQIQSPLGSLASTSSLPYLSEWWVMYGLVVEEEGGVGDKI